MVIWGWKWRKAHRQCFSACDAAICFWHVLEGNTCVNAEIQMEVGLRYGKQATNQSSKNNGITICKWPSRQSQSLKDIYSLFRPIALGDEPPSWVTFFFNVVVSLSLQSCHFSLLRVAQAFGLFKEVAFLIRKPSQKQPVKLPRVWRRRVDFPLPNLAVEMLDLPACSVAALQGRCWRSTWTTIYSPKAWLHRRVECIKISPCKSCKSCFAGNWIVQTKVLRALRERIPSRFILPRPWAHCVSGRQHVAFEHDRVFVGREDSSL